MIKKLRKLIINAGMTDEEYDSIKNAITKSNMQNLRIFPIIAFVFLLVMFILSFVIDGITHNRWLYFLAAAVDMIALLLPWIFRKRQYVFSTISMYIFLSVLFSFALVLGAVKNTDQLAVTFIAILLVGPLLFTDRPIRMITFIYIYVVLYIVTALKYKSGDALTGDIFDTVTFGSISAIAGTYMMSVKCRAHLYEKRTVTLSETDLLTGLRNRNSFERNIQEYPAKCRDNIVCVYADVNGLHETNNLKGHEAGDKMLKVIADRLAEQFGTQHTYRVGGDEFVAFALDFGEDVKAVLDNIAEQVRREGYHVSLGYAVRERSGIDMDELIKAAESEMFAAKKVFYAETGYHRRAGV